MFEADIVNPYQCADGIERNTYIWQPDKPKAVFLAIHGGLSHGGDYQTLGVYFRQHGIATVAPNLTGHGTAKKIVINQFEDFLKDAENCLAWVKERYPELPIFVIGHSMGGLIATYLGLTRFKSEAAIKGYILSSPFYVNCIPINPFLLKLAPLLSAIAPKLTVPTTDFKKQLTHDEVRTQTIFEHVEKGHRAMLVSCRFASELKKAQDNLPLLASQWNHPLLVFIAGEDYLSDVAGTHKTLDYMPADKVTRVEYPENYHENFNELNRDEVFAAMGEWLNKLF